MSKVTGAVRHVHRYTRTFPYKRQIEPVWACSLDDCTHFLPLGMKVIGRRSICCECGDEFIMRDHNLKEDYPTCTLICAESQAATAQAAKEDITVSVVEQTEQEKEDAETVRKRQELWDLYYNNSKRKQ